MNNMILMKILKDFKKKISRFDKKDNDMSILSNNNNDTNSAINKVAMEMTMPVIKLRLH